jgi:hypothetical protein
MRRTAQAQAKVEAMIRAGARFEQVESYIDGCRGLTREVRSALWLLAWAETTPGERRRVVRELVADSACGTIRVLGPGVVSQRAAVSPVPRR